MKNRTALSVFFLAASISALVSACGSDALAFENTDQAAEATNGFDGMPASGTTATCPVTKNEFQVKENSQRSIYKGKTYVFCCSGCKPQFDENPEKFIKK